MPDTRLSRSDDDTIVWLWINGATHTFSHSEWEEHKKLIRDFTHTHAKSIQNFPELPTRTPLHANAPRIPQPKASLDDLV